MSFLALGIAVLQEHVDQRRVIDMQVSADDTSRRLPIPLTVVSAPKRAFQDLLYLYSVQAP